MPGLQGTTSIVTGHFALTALLLPQITGRVVTVSSLAHRNGRLDLADPNWERRRYGPWAAYSQSKLANLLFTAELQRRLNAARSTVRAMAAHPGFAATEPATRSGPAMARGAAVLIRLVGQPAGAGALPTVFAATADLPGGSFVGPGGRGGLRGAPVLLDLPRAARHVHTAQRLWELSQELTSARVPQFVGRRE